MAQDALLVAFLTTAALAASTPSSALEPNLSGMWVLDEELSDDPGATVEKADHGGTVGRVVRSTSGTISVFGIPVPLPSRDEGAEPRSHDSESLVKSGHVLSVVDRLTIAQDSRATELVYDNLKTATYEHEVALDTGYSTVVAHWSGDRLVVEHALLGGAEIVETYELDAGGEQLSWNVRVKNKGIRTIRISRVYSRGGAAQQLNFAALPRVD